MKFLGTSLLEMGVNNHKVAVIGEKSYEWIVTYLATANTGNVIVPLDKELGTKEIIRILTEVECKAFVYSAQYREVAKEAIKAVDWDLILIDTEKDHDQENTNSLSIWQLIDRGNDYLIEGNAFRWVWNHGNDAVIRDE